jgi:hypothetical protein
MKKHARSALAWTCFAGLCVPFLSGASGGCDRFIGGTYDVDANGIPAFVGTDYIELAKRSMKHYFEPKEDVDWTAVRVFSPVAGSVARLDEEWVGTQVRIRSRRYPAFEFILFHVNLSGPLHVGDAVAAGQQLGTLVGTESLSDIAVKVNTPRGTKMVSYFSVLTDDVFRQYQARGLASREDAIISKDVRDAHPLTCSGETFADGGTLENWVTLN